MTSPVQNLLNSTIGIQDLLAMPDTPNLPRAKEIASSVLQQTGLENLYNTGNARTAAEALLCPDIGDGRVVTPEIFNAQLVRLYEKLKQSKNPKMQALLDNEIRPLIENGMLLSAYRGLMLGG